MANLTATKLRGATMPDGTFHDWGDHPKRVGCW
jgi:hypothetical protein